MDALPSPLAERFSLVRGGLVDRLRDRFGPRGHKRERVVQSALLPVLIAWLPLLILSLFEGLAYRTQVKVPFLRDFAVNVRFLMALPILILAEPIIDRRWRRLVLEFPRSRTGQSRRTPGVRNRHRANHSTAGPSAPRRVADRCGLHAALAGQDRIADERGLELARREVLDI